MSYSWVLSSPCGTPPLLPIWEQETALFPFVHCSWCYLWVPFFAFPPIFLHRKLVRRPFQHSSYSPYVEASPWVFPPHHGAVGSHLSFFALPFYHLIWHLLLFAVPYFGSISFPWISMYRAAQSFFASTGGPVVLHQFSRSHSQLSGSFSPCSLLSLRAFFLQEDIRTEGSFHIFVYSYVTGPLPLFVFVWFSFSTNMSWKYNLSLPPFLWCVLPFSLGKIAVSRCLFPFVQIISSFFIPPSPPRNRLYGHFGLSASFLLPLSCLLCSVDQVLTFR